MGDNKKLNFYQRLIAVQHELKAPKNQKNSFGNYKYRSCEDILEAVKPLLNKYQLVMRLFDELEVVGDRIYIKANCLVMDTDGVFTKTEAYAREGAEKKGMDPAQLTGATSSYARKYALCGMFLIDDTKDPDTNEFTQQANKQVEQQKKDEKAKKEIAKILKDMVTNNQITSDEVTITISQLFNKEKFDQLTLAEAKRLMEEVKNGSSKG